jgi:hypothetical protein
MTMRYYGALRTMKRSDEERTERSREREVEVGGGRRLLLPF